MSLAEVLAAVRKGAKQTRTTFSMIFYGHPPSVMSVVLHQLRPMTLGGGELTGYSTRDVHIFLPKDDPLGPREQGDNNVNRLATIFSNKAIRPSHSFVISHIPWSPVIVKHLLGLLEITGAYLNFRNSFLLRTGVEVWKTAPGRMGGSGCNYQKIVRMQKPEPLI